MTRRIVLLVLVLGWLLLPAAPTDAGSPAPPTVVVVESPFGDAVVMDGVLAPVGAVEIKLEPKRYSGGFEILEAAPAGPVEPGQTLVRFDREPFDRQLEAAALELDLARTRFEQKEVEFAREADELRHDLAEARRAHRLAKQKLERFETVERQLRIDEAELSMDWSRDGLANQLEELQQLEKMYKEDDLTEETEEIVLRRARRSYERSKRSFEYRKLRHKWFLEQTLPRDHESLQLALTKQELRLDKATKSLELQKREAELEHQKATRALAEKKRSYEELKQDQEIFVLRAPSSGGHALPGAFKGGRWTGLGENGVRWKPGDKVKSGVLYTVFSPTRLGIHASVGQEDLPDVRPGRACTVTCSVAPGLTFPAEIDSVADYAEGGKYEVRIALQAGHPWFRAGQKVKATLMGDAAPVAVNVPACCVVGKGRKAHVLVLGATGPEKRSVKLGERIGDRVGIKDGLAAGEHVVLDPPKADDAPADKKKKDDEREKPDEGKEKAGEDEAGEKPETSEADEPRRRDDDPEEAKESIVGTWRGRIEGPDPFPPEGLEGALIVTRNDAGDLEAKFEMAGQAIPIEEIEFDPEDGTVRFEAGSDRGGVRGEGTVDGDRLEGTWTSSGGLEGTFVFEREEDV